MKQGRPVASKGHQIRARNRALAQADVKPLDVLIQTMASRWNEAKAAKTPAARAKLELQACNVAEKVAPYLHPKLQATTLKGDAGAPVGVSITFASADALKAAIRGTGGEVTEGQGKEKK